jgi:hypothetical protein
VDCLQRAVIIAGPRGANEIARLRESGTLCHAILSVRDSGAVRVAIATKDVAPDTTGAQSDVADRRRDVPKGSDRCMADGSCPFR